VTRPSRTGMYYAGRVWRLSTPLDLLRFSPLSSAIASVSERWCSGHDA
jgi:hypothetical protein